MTDVLQEEIFGDADLQPSKDGTSPTFADNLALPIHRWFRYSAGFSARWAGELIAERRALGASVVLDPFAGSGTVLLEGERHALPTYGVEAHPFVTRVARAKLHWREDPRSLTERAKQILDRARASASSDALPGYPDLIVRCYPPVVLSHLDALRRAWGDYDDGSPASELSWLALVAILRQCSPVGTAQWQYVLPNKSKANVADPFDAFVARADLMASDMMARQRLPAGPAAQLYGGDARDCEALGDGSVDLVVTSPPYANNYDYADATRLEMSFLGEVAGWGDLHDAVRQHLVRSCSQHAGRYRKEIGAIIEDPILSPIREELEGVVAELSAVRETKAGNKAYDALIAFYFHDLARVWTSLRRVCREGSLVCFVVGDSAPYGVHAPVERWLGQLAVASGFKAWRFEKLRDRNTKWKNRKHRVPLHEGRLWVEG